MTANPPPGSGTPGTSPSGEPTTPFQGVPPGPSLGSGSIGSPIPVRPLTVWALLALAAVIIGFGFLTWILPPAPGDILGRFSVSRFTTPAVLVGPVLAVLLATRWGPPLARVKLIGTIALIEYAAAFGLGFLAFLLTLVDRFTGLHGGVYAVGGVLDRLGGLLVDALSLGLLGLAGLWAYLLFARSGGRLPHLNVRG